MPGGDGTGPGGMGPMTGRAAGFCAGYGVPGYMNPAGGRGFFGRGIGRGGRGRRNWYYATGVPGYARAAWGMPAWGQPRWGGAPIGGAVPWAGVAGAQAPSRSDQVEFLNQQASALEQQLDAIRASIAALEEQSDE